MIFKLWETSLVIALLAVFATAPIPVGAWKGIPFRVFFFASGWLVLGGVGIILHFAGWVIYMIWSTP